mmetsp:Transcript_79014/g.256193  ORF Transcript_79014/g.256193 Transcript_79014/m.256193 type:complete len:349 (+) Transcript_79014:1784-2830(+)
MGHEEVALQAVKVKHQCPTGVARLLGHGHDELLGDRVHTRADVSVIGVEWVELCGCDFPLGHMLLDEAAELDQVLARHTPTVWGHGVVLTVALLHWWVLKVERHGMGKRGGADPGHNSTLSASLSVSHSLSLRSKALLAEGRGVSPTAPKQWPPLARRPERRQRSRRKLHASSDAAKAALAPTSAISPSSPCLLPRSSNPGTADALQPSLLLQVLLGARLGRPLPVARGEALGVGLAALPVSLDHRKQSPPLDLTPLDAHSLGGRDRPTNHAPWHLVPGQGLRGWRPLAGAGAGERRQPQRALGIGPRGPGVSPHIQRSAGRPDLASSDVVRPNEVRVFTQLPRAETA